MKHTRPQIFGGLGLLIAGQALAQNQPADPNAIEAPSAVWVMSADVTAALPQGLNAAFAADATPVRIDWSTLEAQAGNDRITILTPDGVLRATIESQRTTGPQSAVWRGHLTGDRTGWLILSRVGDALSGWVQDAESGVEYEVRYGGPQTHWVYRVDSAARQICGGTAGDPPAHEDDDESQPPNANAPSPELSQSICPSPQPVIDYLIVYTGLARQAAGGTSAIQSVAQLYVEYANLAYANSNIDLRMRAVYTDEITYNEVRPPDDNPPFSSHLNRISDSSDGVMDNVISLRMQYRADGVMLMLADTGMGGLAWCCTGSVGGTYATMYWNNGGGTFAHEYGHNQGCAHDPANVDCGGCTNYARGHFFTGVDSVQYGTVMSYIGTGAPYFSNPSVSFKGAATGIANQRDNARVVRDRRFAMESIYATRSDIWVQRNNFGGDGTYASPYPSILAGTTNILTPVGPGELPTLHVDANTYFENLTISKPMRIEGCGGTVVIGS